MPVAPKESVFKTGPDDSLRVVDVYGEGEILSAFEGAAAAAAAAQEAAADGQSPEEAEKALSQNLQALKAALAQGELELLLEKLLSLGLSVGQLRSFIKTPFPLAVDVTGFFNRFRGMGINETNALLAFIQTTMSSDDYRSLNNKTLPVHVESVNQILGAMDRGQLNGDDLYLDAGITRGDSRLEVLETLSDLGPRHPLPTKVRTLASINSETILKTPYLSPEEIVAAIEAADLTPEERLFIQTQVALAAANSGNHAQVAALIEAMGSRATPSLRRDTVRRLLNSYRLDRAEPKSAHSGMAEAFYDNLNLIDEGCLTYDREGDLIIDYTLFRYASDDAIKVFTSFDPLKSTAIMAMDLDTDPKSLGYLIQSQYPSLAI
jgi:hypothetical protein